MRAASHGLCSSSGRGSSAWRELRRLIAPNRVNFHLEHHLLMTVPHYNLPRLHQMLKSRRVLEDACVTTGYWSVLELASSKAA